MNVEKKQSAIIWLRFWIVGFFLINIACHLSAGTNADSRFAALLALVENHNFQIDPYVNLTVDWSQTPDGHFYSNKAPGPILIAAPFFFSIVKLGFSRVENRSERERLLIKYKASWLKLFSYLFQLLPFMFIGYFWSLKLLEQKVDLPTVCLSLAALLFGNTAAVFMSAFYGHGMTAVWVLSMVLCARFQKYYGVGLCFGFAVLTDYSAILFALPLLLLIQQDAKTFIKIILGGLFPLCLWILYHSSCFGSPFHIANQFQNPLFKDVTERGNLWGILLPFPKFTTLAQLIGGPSRGMIWVVPWILVLIVWSLVNALRGRGADISAELKFSIFGLGLLLIMNSCFGGWHGGLTPGPRYLSSIFPVFALSIPFCFGKMSVGWQRVLFVSICSSVFFTALVYSTNISPPLVPLWPLYLRQTVVNPTASSVARMALVLPLLIYLTVKTLKWPRNTT